MIEKFSLTDEQFADLEDTMLNEFDDDDSAAVEAWLEEKPKRQPVKNRIVIRTRNEIAGNRRTRLHQCAQRRYAEPTLAPVFGSGARPVNPPMR